MAGMDPTTFLLSEDRVLVLAMQAVAGQVFEMRAEAAKAS